MNSPFLFSMSKYRNTKNHVYVILLITFIHTVPLYGGEIDTVAIYSEAMDTTLFNIVVVPSHYLENDTRYSVLYLLHGWSGSYSDWSRKTDLPALVDRYDILIVCPEGGYASWYLDSPVNPKSQYASYIAEEVVGWIDINYRTNDTPNNRAITGLSMGGHGALFIATEFPNRFAAAGSMSGVLDLSKTRLLDGIYSLLGENNSKELDHYSAIYRLDKLIRLAPNILIDCGVNDRYCPSNRELHRKLNDQNIEHTYLEREGGHSWEYWIGSLESHIKFFHSNLGWE